MGDNRLATSAWVLPVVLLTVAAQRFTDRWAHLMAELCSCFVSWETEALMGWMVDVGFQVVSQLLLL